MIIFILDTLRSSVHISRALTVGGGVLLSVGIHLKLEGIYAEVIFLVGVVVAVICLALFTLHKPAGNAIALLGATIVAFTLTLSVVAV